MVIHDVLCDSCRNLFTPVLLKFSHEHCPGFAVYYYDETIRTYLYQFKGCYDYELYPVFLCNYAWIFHYRYRDYTVIPAPSYPPDDEMRGFNHVEMIFSLLKLKMVKFFTKTEHHKQADCIGEERQEISKYLQVNSDYDLKDKKVLLVDDVFTTGETMRTMINLIKPYKPKKIEILVLSKTI